MCFGSPAAAPLMLKLLTNTLKHTKKLKSQASLRCHRDSSGDGNDLLFSSGIF